MPLLPVVQVYFPVWTAAYSRDFRVGSEGPAVLLRGDGDVRHHHDATRAVTVGDVRPGGRVLPAARGRSVPDPRGHGGD